MKKQDTFYAELSNGLRIVHRKIDQPVAYCGIAVGAGTRHEAADESGLAHFIEHCVFKGSQRHTARQMLRRVEDVGAEMNAYTTKEETVYYAATPIKYIARVMETLAEMLFQPAFPIEEIEKEKQVIQDEIESYNDSPAELIYDDFEALLFDGNPLSRPILGSKRSLSRLNKAKALSFMERYYRPSNMVFFSLSPLPMHQLTTLAERFFCQTAGENTLFSKNPDTPLSYTPQLKDLHRHTHQAHVMMGSRAYPLQHERQMAMYLLNNLLGGGSLSSRLNLSLREQRGLVYTIESTYTPLSDTGYWSVYFATEAEEREECEKLVEKELRLLREKPLSTAALHRAKQQLRGQMAISATNLENTALAMGKQMLYYGQAPTWQETFEQIDRLTAQELQACAIEVFDPDQLSILRYN